MRLLITEPISIRDFILKYTIRDVFLGCLSMIPGSVGVALRMVFYPAFFLRCGRGLTIKPFVMIKFPERITLGDHVGISEYSLVDGDGGIDLGNFVRIGSHTSIVSFEHNYQKREIPIKLQGKVRKKIRIEDDCWVGSGVRILAGVTIGRGSVIGAGSVVKHDVPEYSVAVGVPARVIRTRT